MERRNYNIKIDDMLLYLLKEYHGIDASDAMAFFTDRVEDMRDCPANINGNSRPSTIVSGLDGRTAQVKWSHTRRRHYGKPAVGREDEDTRFYVLRGFYPESNLPFKIVAVYANGPNAYGAMHRDQILHVKVIMGMKPHWTSLNSKDVYKYKEHVSEAILLDQPVMESQKINYKYRTFKCMRPKGMELYRERNYEEKQREAARKRREAKND